MTAILRSAVIGGESNSGDRNPEGRATLPLVGRFSETDSCSFKLGPASLQSNSNDEKIQLT